MLNDYKMLNSVVDINALTFMSQNEFSPFRFSLLLAFVSNHKLLVFEVFLFFPSSFFKIIFS